MRQILKDQQIVKTLNDYELLDLYQTKKRSEKLRKYEILDEAKVLDAIAKNDEVALRSKELTGPKIISRTISGDKITNENLKDMIKSLEDMI